MVEAEILSRFCEDAVMLKTSWQFSVNLGQRTLLTIDSVIIFMGEIIAH